MKYIKIILVAVLAVVLPFAILRAGIEYNDLAEVSGSVLYLYPIYLPFFCGWFGIKLFKDTGKIFLPTIIFNLFLIVSVYLLTEMIFNSIERSLTDAVIGLLLYGPMVYSVPISPVAAAIYKHKKKKAAVVICTSKSV